jgi:transposase-like protein
MTKRITPTPWVEMQDNTKPDATDRRPNLIALSGSGTEVPAKHTRRQFSAEYKLKILREVDACTEPGQIGAICRREGLYSSLLTTWRHQRDKGNLATPVKRGRKANPEAKRIAELEKEIKRLNRKLHQAEVIIDVQKKVSALLGITLATPDEENV